ncbi:protein phosphatase [Oryzisolibacter propanilivorax]|uniref:Protein phosphatase n=1 Tax=Oryzisolibacter propanilivorax TaxID=1527607 RepID=A0A1G9Q6A0_9BURK|nr:PP2C family serine/threonine-protein phosphatase [Oryzisolibacter propanilivorax]SDM06540.1 protein phosphatase [Oryzisolibacter propanilivorax]
MRPPTPYAFHALTDTGRVRTQNEDAFAVHAEAGLVLLADGMGGYNAGEVAAHMAVEQVGAQLLPWLDSPEGQGATPAAIGQALADAIQQANHAILGTALSDRDCHGMGTTLVAGVFRGALLVLAHVGDSRCYRLRAGVLEQLTRDHSWLQEQLDAGLMSPAQAAASDLRNLVTRALGVEGVAQPDVATHAVRPGDLYVFSSDGLTDVMQPEELAALARQDGLPLAERAQRLVALANALGGRDNISVVLAQAPAALPPGAPPASPKRRAGLVSRLLRGGAGA